VICLPFWAHMFLFIDTKIAILFFTLYIVSELSNVNCNGENKIKGVFFFIVIHLFVVSCLFITMKVGLYTFSKQCHSIDFLRTWKWWILYWKHQPHIPASWIVVLFVAVKSVKVTDIEYDVMSLHFYMFQPLWWIMLSFSSFQISISCEKQIMSMFGFDLVICVMFYF
jgi:hypothetical protein